MIFNHLTIKIKLERDKKKIGKGSFEYTDKGFFIDIFDGCLHKDWYEPITNFAKTRKKIIKDILNEI
jgi:hypothetical protein